MNLLATFLLNSIYNPNETFGFNKCNPSCSLTRRHMQPSKSRAVGFTQRYSELHFQLKGRWHTCSYDWTRQLLPGCTEGFDWPWQLPMLSLVLVLAKCVCVCIINEVTALPYCTNASELMFIPLIKLRLWPLWPSLKGDFFKKLHCVFGFGACFKHYWAVLCLVSFNQRKCIEITYVDAILGFCPAGIIMYIYIYIYIYIYTQNLYI